MIVEEHDEEIDDVNTSCRVPLDDYEFAIAMSLAEDGKMDLADAMQEVVRQRQQQEEADEELARRFQGQLEIDHVPAPMRYEFPRSGGFEDFEPEPDQHPDFFIDHETVILKLDADPANWRTVGLELKDVVVKKAVVRLAVMADEFAIADCIMALFEVAPQLAQSLKMVTISDYAAFTTEDLQVAMFRAAPSANYHIKFEIA
jgi:hypothetical protein